jgi:catechol-2,3-dioxygenase
MLNFAVDCIDHVEVFVRDLAAAQRWYREILGLETIFQWEPEPIMIGAGGTMLALFKSEEGDRQTTDRPHWHRVAWKIDGEGFAAAQEHLREQGIPFRGPIDHDVTESIYFDDPDGNPLEITTYK